MRGIGLWLALAAAPFWEGKAPRDWSETELTQMLTNSPWAQAMEGGGTAILATALPIREAEQERERRRKKKGSEPADTEYADFLAQDQGQHIVLAIPYPDARALADASESKKMEEESILKIGKKKYRMTGHFSPTPSDPYLRLVYPREVGPNDKGLAFELYLPGLSLGYRMVEFRIKDLAYHGRTEM